MTMRQRVVFLTIVLAAGAIVSSSFAEPEQEYGKIEIIRDGAGVPNVFSDTDEGAMYGVGYAAAKDRAFQMYYCARIMQGRVSELLGDVKQAGKQGRKTTVENDKLMRTLGWFRSAQTVAGNLDSGTKSLLKAYCEGVNDYIADNPEDLLHLFGELGLEPEPWTPGHCILTSWHLGYVFYGSGLKNLSTKSAGAGQKAGRVVDNAAAVVKREDVTEDWIRKTEEFVAQHGMKSREAVGGLCP